MFSHTVRRVNMGACYKVSTDSSATRDKDLAVHGLSKFRARNDRKMCPNHTSNLRPPHPHLHQSQWHSLGRQLESRTTSSRVRNETDGLTGYCSYNRYLAVAARVVRRSLKEDKRLVAERRGEMDLRFAKWEVRYSLKRCYPECYETMDRDPH